MSTTNPVPEQPEQPQPTTPTYQAPPQQQPTQPVYQNQPLPPTNQLSRGTKLALRIIGGVVLAVLFFGAGFIAGHHFGAERNNDGFGQHQRFDRTPGGFGNLGDRDGRQRLNQNDGTQSGQGTLPGQPGQQSGQTQGSLTQPTPQASAGTAG